MNTFFVYFVTILFVFIIIHKIKRRDIVIVESKIDNRKYICRKLPDAENAANKLAMINKRILTLIEHVNNKDHKNIQRLKKDIIQINCLKQV